MSLLNAQLGLWLNNIALIAITGMAKIKVSKEESGSSDFVEQRRAALERWVTCSIVCIHRSVFIVMQLFVL